LVLACAAHYRLARSYYVYNFGQSHDAQAFLEYTYHRISWLRYLVALIGVLKKVETDDAKRTVVVRAFALVGPLLRDAVGDQRFEAVSLRFQFRGGSLLRAAIEGGLDGNSLPQLRAELVIRHAKEARTLLRAWQRHESLLRLQLPAQQLLAWCKRLAEEELKYRCERVVVDYDSTDTGKDPAPYLWPPGGELVASPAVDRLQRVISNLRVKLWAERGDYDYVIAERCKRSEERRVG